MRLLVVAPRFPWPLDKGDRLTVHNLVRHFSQRHDVALVSFVGPDGPPDDMGHLSDVAARIDTVPLGGFGSYLNTSFGLLSRTPLQVRYFRSRAMKALVRRVIEEFRPDVSYAHTIRMAPYLEDAAGPTVLAMQISMALNYRRLAEFATKPVWRMLYRIETRRAAAYEPKIARRFDLSLLISETDAAALGDRPPNVLINPHGVDFEYFSRSEGAATEPGRIVFTGNMAYPPNVDAAEWFATEMLPLVRGRVPAANLSIVGADPHPRVTALAADPAVEVTGRVPDLRPHLERAAVGIDPLRIGAGLQNKILEGMAMALPMVVTSVANEGIGATPGTDLVVADDAAGFADAVSGLLEDPGERARLGGNARRFIEDHWSWETHFDDLERAMLALTDRQGGGPPGGG